MIAPDFETDPANCGGCLISCDDADPCTIDTCVAGECVNTPVDCSGLDDQCNVGVCVGGFCEAQPANEGELCDDENACTEGETCQCGACTGGAAVICDDGNACTTDTCDPATGCLNTPVDCNDDNACTTDSCDPDSGCINTPIICDDGDACTIDSCDPASGCRFEPVICGPEEVCFGGECVGSCPDGGSCDSGFPVCDDPAKGCVCFAAVGGLNLCVFPRACSAVVPCDEHEDCPPGEFCLTNDCCGGTCGLPCPDDGFTVGLAAVESDEPNQAGT